MSWNQWQAGPPIPSGEISQPSILPVVAGGTIPGPAPYNPTAIPSTFNYSGMTPDQQYAIQQNWQQWQNYQQQYAQWHAQYGEQYQREMQAKLGAAAPPIPFAPTVPSVPAAPQVAPPSLPSNNSIQTFNQVAQPPVPTAYPSVPPPPPEQDFKQKQNDFTSEKPPPPPPPDNSENLHLSVLSTTPPKYQRANDESMGSKNHFGRNNDFDYQQNNRNNINRGNHNREFSENRRYDYNRNTTYNSQPQSHNFNLEANRSRSLNQNLDSSVNMSKRDGESTKNIESKNASDFSREEKLFDVQFQKWEEEFENWKKANVNHPDKRAYREYEMKFEDCRRKLVERREQMRRRKMEQQQRNLSPQKQNYQVPLSNAKDYNQIDTLQQQNLQSQEENLEIEKQQQQQQQQQQDQKQEPLPNIQQETVTEEKDIEEERCADLEEEFGQQNEFLKPSNANSGGIPGLDLVPEEDNCLDKEKTVPANVDEVIDLEKPTLKSNNKNQQNFWNQTKISSSTKTPLLFGTKASPNQFEQKKIPSLLDAHFDPMKIPSLLDQKIERPESSPPGNRNFSESTYCKDFKKEVKIDQEIFGQNSLIENKSEVLPMLQEEQKPTKTSDDGAEKILSTTIPDITKALADPNVMALLNTALKTNTSFENSNILKQNDSNDILNTPKIVQLENLMSNERDIDNSFSDNSFNFQNQRNMRDDDRGNFNNPWDRGNLNMNWKDRSSNQFSNNMRFGNDNSGGGFNNWSKRDDQQKNWIDSNIQRNDNGGRNPFNNRDGRRLEDSDDRKNPFNSSSRGWGRDRENNQNQVLDRGIDNNQDRGREKERDNRNNRNRDQERNQDRNQQNNRSRSGNRSKRSRFDRQEELFDQNLEQTSFNQNPFKREPAGANDGPQTNTSSNFDEYFKPAQVIDYQNKPLGSTFENKDKTDNFPAAKVVDYGHKPSNVTDNVKDDFFPMKTIDYGHASNKKNEPENNKSEGFSGFGDFLASKSTGGNSNKKKKKKRNIKVAESNPTYPGSWILLNPESRKRPGLPTKRGKRKKLNKNSFSENIQNVSDDQKENFDQISDNEEKFDDINSIGDNIEEFHHIDQIQLLADFLTSQSNSNTLVLQSITTIDSNATLEVHSDEVDRLSEYRPIVPLKNTVQLIFPSLENHSTITIDEILLNPGRKTRPKNIVIILRGPPGSGKSYISKIIKEKEVEMKGCAPRILSIDDYYMVEVDKEEKCQKTGRKIMKKDLVYEYDKDMETKYFEYLMKSFKKTLSENLFNFVIVDYDNYSLRTFTEFYNFAKAAHFTPYTIDLFCNLEKCLENNIHNRSKSDIEKIIKNWKPTPEHYIKLDIQSLFQLEDDIQEVEMEDAFDIIDQEEKIENSILEDDQDSQENEVDFIKSKWDGDQNFDRLARLDGTSKKLQKHNTLEDYLQTDGWEPPPSSSKNKKRVRWADIEEKRAQDKMRAIGFVVGQTDWSRMMDPTAGSSALTKTKFIEKVNKQVFRRY